MQKSPQNRGSRFPQPSARTLSHHHRPCRRRKSHGTSNLNLPPRHLVCSRIRSEIHQLFLFNCGDSEQ